jgi:hypothetical protein
MRLRIVRAAIVTVSLLVCVSASAPPATPAAANPPALARYLPEVRLRKVHLVRPDLIDYPIYYEVLC